MYSVRQIYINELDKLIELYSFLHDHDDQIDTEKLKKSWNIICSNPNIFIYFVIENKNRFLCSCNLTIVPNLTRGGRSFAVIENVVTHPDYRRQGLACKVLEKAILHAKENNCYKVMLLSSAERSTGHKLYEKLGFSNTAKKGFVLKF